MLVAAVTTVAAVVVVVAAIKELEVLAAETVVAVVAGALREYIS